MKRAALIIALLTIFACIGCSSGGNPTAPGEPGVRNPEAGSTHQLWGFYTIEADTLNQTMRVIAARETEFHLNVVGFLEGPGCIGCLSLENFVWTENHVSLDVGFRHPFVGLTEFSGFDVRGIVMFDGSYIFPASNLRTKGPGDGGLSNPDGYTALYSSATDEYLKAEMGSIVPPDATLNGYRRHYHLEARHMFRPIATPQYRKYEIDFPTNGDFLNYFNYAVDASWEYPVQVPATIEDFGINANCWEAYEITTELDGLITSTAGSSAELNIFVNDWQGPDTIESVAVEAPELFTGTEAAVLEGSGLYPEWGGWAKYSVVVSNDKAILDPEEPFRVLISVVDEKSGEDPKDITAYQIYDGEISPNEPPVAVAEVDNDSPSTGTEVHFTGHDSYDPEDGAVSEYHWDLDGDGSYDDSIEPDPPWTYDSEGTYYVDLRVYDSMGAWDALDTTIEINVTGGVEVTLPEYNDKTLHDTADPSKGFRMHLFNSPPGGLVYQWSSGPKLQEAWDFTTYGITDSGYRMYKSNPWAAASCSSPWSGHPCVETATTAAPGNLLYQGVLILDWVYDANLSNNTLRMAGWDGWDELEDPLHIYADYTWADHVSPSSWLIHFPLSIDNTGEYYSGGGGGFLQWADFWAGPCGQANFTSATFNFDVIGQGTVKTDFYTSPEPCILVRHVYTYSIGAGAVILTKDVAWYEWICDDGSTAAFMTTFNNSNNPYGAPNAATRFNTSSPNQVTGQSVIGQRYN